MKQFALFLLCTVFSYAFSLNEIIFNSDIYIKNITNEEDSLKQYQTCNTFYNNLVEDNYVCIFKDNFEINDNEKNIKKEKEFFFIFETMNIYINELTLSNNDINTFYIKNNDEINHVKKNFEAFYILTNLSVKTLFKNLINIILDKFMLFYDKFYLFIESNLQINAGEEEIILPISQKIRYFTNATIDRYDDCIDFIESLHYSTCFSTDKNRIFEAIKNLIDNI